MTKREIGYNLLLRVACHQTCCSLQFNFFVRRIKISVILRPLLTLIRLYYTTL